MPQKNRCTIDTVLGHQNQVSGGNDDSPLMLAQVQGTESLSEPYGYAVTMYRTFKQEDKRPLRPEDLIDTVARIGIRNNSEDYTYRVGVFGSFGRDENVVVGPSVYGKFVVYKATIVPAFKRLDCETRYRVFSDKRLDEIAESIFAGFPNLDFGKYVRLSNFHWSDLPKLPYSVQFGESSFNFLSRLMSSLGVWYYFSFDGAQDPTIWWAGDPAHSETLVLGRGVGQVNGFPACTSPFNDVVAGKPSDTDISKFGTDYASAPKRTLTGEFNQLNPTKPLQVQSKLDSGFDVDPGAGKADGASRFQYETFPAESFLWHGAGPADAVTRDADARMRQNESAVYLVHGHSKNSTFVCGKRFYVSKDKSADDPHVEQKPDTYLIKTLSIYAYESCYGHHLGNDILTFLSDIFIAPFKSGESEADFATAVAANGLNNYLKQEFYYLLSGGTTSMTPLNLPGVAPHSYQFGVSGPSLGNYFKAGALASVTAACSAVEGAVKDLIKNHLDDFSASFLALRFPVDVTAIPLPVAGKPVAAGPHLATVIGDGGVDTAKSGEISADALGRVRIRFPWDRESPPFPAGAAATEPNQNGSQDRPQFLRGDNTCWVRVSEAWAGHGHGSQFLPRIGDEVLVEFVAGDPERPLITGRLYNAKNKLPFPTKDGVKYTPDEAYLLNPGGPEPTPSKEKGPGPGPNTRSGIRTRLTPKSEGFHLLGFEDSAEAPQLLLRSQGRLDVTAISSRYETTLGNRHVKVTEAKDKNGHSVGGNSFTTIAGECDVHIGAARYEQVERNYELTVKADTLLDLQGRLAAVVGGAASIAADGIVFEAATRITLKVGASTIVLSPCAIYLNGPVLHHNAGDGGAESAAAVTLQNVADAEKADDGSDNTPKPANGNGKGSGARRTHTASPKEPLVCSSDPLAPVNIEIATEGAWPNR